MQRISLTFLFISICFSLSSEEIYNESWALIVGINKYENVRKLEYSTADAIAMRDVLVEKFGFTDEKITLLLDNDATKDNIIKEFANIALQAQKNDRVLVFFAGHGETMDMPSGGQMGYLIPVDGNPDNLYLSAIPMDELKRLSAMSNAKHMLYLIDACYGGILAVGTRAFDITKPNYIEKKMKYRGRQIITAGGRDEEVIEKPEWGHSAFTRNLERGLKNGSADLDYDGYISASELGMFLSNKVTIDSDNQQTPEYGRMTTEDGEFVFVFNADTANIYINEKPESVIIQQPKIDYTKLAKEIVNQSQDDKDAVVVDRQYQRNLREKNIFGISMFGNSRQVVRKIRIKGGFLISVFGNMQRTFEDIELFDEKNVLYVFSAYGNASLILPPDINTDVQLFSIFGKSVNNISYDDHQPIDTDKVLTIIGIGMFGRLTVSNSNEK